MPPTTEAPARRTGYLGRSQAPALDWRQEDPRMRRLLALLSLSLLLALPAAGAGLPEGPPLRVTVGWPCSGGAGPSYPTLAG